MQKAFFQIQEVRLEFPDAIFKIGRLVPVVEGWVVKTNFGQNLQGEEGAVEAIHLASETTNTVAGYKDGELDLWDVVEIFDNEEDATKAGKEYGQMSIYQIETGRLKWLE